MFLRKILRRFSLSFFCVFSFSVKTTAVHFWILGKSVVEEYEIFFPPSQSLVFLNEKQVEGRGPCMPQKGKTKHFKYDTKTIY